jgi:hypothetical protein
MHLPSKGNSEMKYMITWNLPHGTYKQTAERFLDTGAPLPEGLTSLGRWHSVDQKIGFHLVETNDGKALIQHAAEWKDLLDMTIVPVLDDAETGEAVSRVFKR